VDIESSEASAGCRRCPVEERQETVDIARVVAGKELLDEKRKTSARTFRTLDG
jgi:hypothetical protein